jgi:peptidoglycan/xylan/chitin deacetylase (PgdA/CDA1 family)
MVYGLFVILFVCVVIFIYVCIPLLYRRCSQILLKREATKAGALVLTFDDGPSSRLTLAIMKLLAEYNAKATFFLLGKNIAGRENIVRQLAKEGHQICSHGYDHLNHLKVSPMRVISDIRRGWQAIDTTIGVQGGTYPFRPPYGKMNLVSLFYLWAKKVPIIFWTVNSGDTWPTGKREVHKAAVSTRIDGGAIVLAHDFDRSSNETSNYVLESLRLSLVAAKESGMRICTVSQLIGQKK